ncbi:MAG: histidyl-tRNA synthetase [Actinomycetota bacterium]|nr:histidyl-tRNA synthetase [Actinomycetota bacterium]
MDLVSPRGTQDLLPPRSEAMLALYEAAHRSARLFGFRYVETPMFEHTELFARAAGSTSDVVSKEMYTFLDKGGRSITLRPETTASVVRAYLSNAHDLPLPFMAYYVGSQFRHGRPQAGRLRELRQFGVEIIGVDGADADVEVIALTDRYLRERGLTKTTLFVNSIGDQVCRPAYRKLLIGHLEPHREQLCEDCQQRLQSNPLRILDCKVDGKKSFVLDAPVISDHLCEPCREHLASLLAGLDRAGMPYEHDPRLVRGLDYYTRTVFEFVSGALSAAQATVCGGGRYDGLAEVLGGPPTPGVGFAMGLDRVLLAMEGESVPLPEPRGLRCFVVAVGEAARASAAAFVDELRDAGLAASTAFEDRPMKAQMKMADRAQASFVAIVGERELAEGVITLKRLADGIQKTVPASDAVGWLTRLDDWTS